MSNYSILVVDDEEIIRKSLSHDLKRVGYEVAIAEDGDVAIKMIKLKKYDLVITDLIMEKMDGISVLKESLKLNASSMVMILTGHATIKTAIDALRLGASDYLFKPYEKDEMILRIKNCLTKLELQRKVKLYEDILPVCCKCNKIRDDTGKMHGEGEWMDLTAYMREMANVKVSHGYCNECYYKVRKQFGR